MGDEADKGGLPTLWLNSARSRWDGLVASSATVAQTVLDTGRQSSIGGESARSVEEKQSKLRAQKQRQAEMRRHGTAAAMLLESSLHRSILVARAFFEWNLLVNMVEPTVGYFLQTQRDTSTPAPEIGGVPTAEERAAEERAADVARDALAHVLRAEVDSLHSELDESRRAMAL